MITPLVQEYLSAYLQGHRSADDTKEILRLIDDAERKDGALLAEFDRVLHAVSKKIPGLTIDFEKLLASDEIECDPLISQGNLALLRLDAIFRQAFAAWTHSGSSLHTIKRITKPEDPATYSVRTEKHERTEETYPPDAQLLNQVVNITLSGFRIQATITHRREQLKSGKQSDQPVSRDATRSASSPQQSSPNGWRGRTAKAEVPDQTDIIDEQEIFNSHFDDLSAPIEGKMPLLIRGVNKISLLKGYNQIEPLTKPRPLAQPIPARNPTPVRSAVRTKIDTTYNAPVAFREEEPVKAELSAPPREPDLDFTNNVSQDSREEELVICELLTPSRDTKSFTHNQPLYHKRE